MLSEFLANNIKSQAGKEKNGYVTYGYGQVEPNHLSAQRTGQIYAQLPAASSIDVLEQGQFVKYDYAHNEVNFTGAGEWMLVYNEIKLYREHQNDCEFAMIKDNYQARVYSPFGGGVDKNGNVVADEVWDRQSRYYNGTDAEGNPIEDVTAGPDMYELHYNENPFTVKGSYKEAMMPEGTTMVPRVFKTNIGDIFTTNMVKETELAVEDELVVGDDGILTKTAGTKAGTMKWQVVKVYTLADHQKAVKLVRIA